MNRAMDSRKQDILRNRILAPKGGWVIGKGVYNQGYSMLDDLVGSLTLMQLHIFNISGRMLDKEDSEIIEACFICINWPDFRVWCNQIGAFGGNNGVDVMSSVTSGLLATNSTMYGVGTIKPIYTFIRDTYLKFLDGENLENYITNYINKYKFVPGFYRPLVKGDLRIDAVERVRKEKKKSQGKYLEFIFQLNNVIVEIDNIHMINIGAYITAIMMDYEFTINETEEISSCATASGILACYNSVKVLPDNSFLPLRCDDIQYKGKTIRSLDYIP